MDPLPRPRHALDDTLDAVVALPGPVSVPALLRREARRDVRGRHTVDRPLLLRGHSRPAVPPPAPPRHRVRKAGVVAGALFTVGAVFGGGVLQEAQLDRGPADDGGAGGRVTDGVGTPVPAPRTAPDGAGQPDVLLAAASASASPAVTGADIGRDALAGAAAIDTGPAAGAAGPAAGTPGVGPGPGAETPVPGAGDIGTPGTGAPGTGVPGTGVPNPDPSGAGPGGTGPGSDGPGSDGPGTGGPGTGGPGTGGPGTGGPGTGGPGGGGPGGGTSDDGPPDADPQPTLPVPDVATPPGTVPAVPVGPVTTPPIVVPGTEVTTPDLAVDTDDGLALDASRTALSTPDVESGEIDAGPVGLGGGAAVLPDAEVGGAAGDGASLLDVDEEPELTLPAATVSAAELRTPDLRLGDAEVEVPDVTTPELSLPETPVLETVGGLLGP